MNSGEPGNFSKLFQNYLILLFWLKKKKGGGCALVTLLLFGGFFRFAISAPSLAEHADHFMQEPRIIPEGGNEIQEMLFSTAQTSALIPNQPLIQEPYIVGLFTPTSPLSLASRIQIESY